MKSKRSSCFAQLKIFPCSLLLFYFCVTANNFVLVRVHDIMCNGMTVVIIEKGR